MVELKLNLRPDLLAIATKAADRQGISLDEFVARAIEARLNELSMPKSPFPQIGKASRSNVVIPGRTNADKEELFEEEDFPRRKAT